VKCEKDSISSVLVTTGGLVSGYRVTLIGCSGTRGQKHKPTSHMEGLFYKLINYDMQVERTVCEVQQHPLDPHHIIPARHVRAVSHTNIHL
jgi:hypothetical protein